ncbi:MAG TPA: HupE/UreJ family protein [Saprospiraceae bacterium]|nr:HupE/UreJ family protein [Saprospiraceae bacterium]
MNKLIGSLMILFLGLPMIVNAHTIDYELVNLSSEDILGQYLSLGFTHIVPLGLDHILFVISLFLLGSKLSNIIWQATAFTVAHSITLGLAMYGYIKPLPEIIEPIIALSIFFVAIENIIVREIKPSRIVIVFIFGLVHGMGFANVLVDLGLPQNDYLLGLFSFNLGVEFGQLVIILMCWLIIGKWFYQKSWYRQRVIIPASCIIALISVYWIYERMV